MPSAKPTTRSASLSNEMLSRKASIPVQRIMFYGADVGVGIIIFREQLGGEFQTSIDVRGGVFGGRGGVVAAFQIAGVVQENTDEAEFKEALREFGLRSGGMTTAEQAGHAERALQRVFQVMVTRVNGENPGCRPRNNPPPSRRREKQFVIAEGNMAI